MLISRWLPPRFIYDCLECDCDVGEVLSQSAYGKKLLLRSTPEQYAELKNRAEYYADVNGPDQCPNLKRAAKSLLKAMDKITEAVGEWA